MMTDAERVNIILALLTGGTLKDIAVRFHRSTATVFEIKKAAGLVPDRDEDAPKWRRPLGRWRWPIPGVDYPDRTPHPVVYDPEGTIRDPQEGRQWQMALFGTGGASRGNR